MPRPGPRPYECVRRAWHSDRHPPIRGSLIQEIFRIVNEVHSSATRKNREWQEKLPIVVLKAEEIMYSKANSEAEYSDLKTLWDRVNDAIDTIIRRDDSTEAGEFLQPCIEAALHLGCTPRRSSRSQRNESPRCYLSPKPTETSSVRPSNLNTKGPHSSQHLTHNTMNSLHYNNSTQNINHNEKKFPGFPKNFPPGHNQLSSVQTHSKSNTWSVYPLCHTNQIQPAKIQFCPAKPSNSYFHLMETDKLSIPQNLSSCQLDASASASASDSIFPSNHEHYPEEGKLIECDLTLRLGSVEVDKGNSSTSVDGRNSRAVSANEPTFFLPSGQFR
ncbi:hypothetical protein ACJIZ3_023179 [Penstemon smallii]|uniref:Histone acetyltransferase n=1 Tax=Penstemon smallii TaxID=265156 RepID=A0ABD3TQR3_9LAMI